MTRHNISAWMILLAAAGGLVSLKNGMAVAQQPPPSAAQIIEALTPKKTAGVTNRSLTLDPRPVKDKSFIDSLRNRPTRLISIEERTKAAEIAKAMPSIDLEITFDYNSDVIGPQAVPTLVNLGTALRSGGLNGTVFILAGHTDAKGDAAYNQSLSEKRADAVRRFLVEKFSLAPGNLIPIGYGKSQLKNPANPFGGENRRVQIVNTEIK